MAPARLEQEDHSRDAAFNKAMHKESSKAKGGFSAMMKKDATAQKAAVDEYFRHWNTDAKVETAEDREVYTILNPPHRCILTVVTAKKRYIRYPHPSLLQPFH